MEAAGYDLVADFCSMTESELGTCAAALEARGVPPGHVGRIIRAMRMGKQEGTARPPLAVAAVPARSEVVAAPSAPSIATVAGGDSAAVQSELRVFVGRLKPAASEEVLREVFAECGRLVSVEITKNPQTGRCRGSAFLTFDSAAAAKAAISRDGVEICGRTARVEMAQVGAASTAALAATASDAVAPLAGWEKSAGASGAESSPGCSSQAELALIPAAVAGSKRVRPE